MAGSMERRRAFEGPALFSWGFRPFFLFGALYAGLAVLLWLPQFEGHLRLSSTLAPLDWHTHEMIYGFVPAIVAGFLLTAIPNWTGRLPVMGAPLMALVALWLAGRIAMAFSAVIGALPAALVDAAFLPVLGAVAAREVVAGNNARNLRVIAAVGLLALGNIVFHVESLRHGAAEYGPRIGLAATLVLIMLVGGRIIPSFTRNWLARRGDGRMPAPFSRFDAVAMAVSAAALALWVGLPSARATGALLVVAGLVNAVRVARWAGERTLADPLVLVLHVAYAFVALGFLVVGLDALVPGLLSGSGGLHAWTTGAIGTMTLSVMTRASLGHTGQALAASRATQAIFACVVVAALARIAADAAPAQALILHHVAALGWAGAFLGFAAAYGRLLATPREA